MEKCKYINGEKYNIPLLIQSLDACLHGQLGYIPPGQNICAFLPLDPESDMYKNFWHEPGNVLYGCSIDHPYYFHREPDGRLSLSEEEYEPDSTVWVDDHLPDILTHQFYIPVFAVDKQNNFYVRACFVTSNCLEDKQYGMKYGRIGARELGKSKEKACTYRGRSGCIRTTVSFGWKISSFHMGNWTQKTIG